MGVPDQAIFHMGETEMSNVTKRITELPSRLVAEDEGATAVEYGLLVGLIAAVIIGAVVILGGNINDAFGLINGQL